jgi:kumamolisin
MPTDSRGRRKTSTPVHPYIHRFGGHGTYPIAKNGVHPYFKLCKAGVVPRDGEAGVSWSIGALCAAYNWPTSLEGGGIIGIFEPGGGWLQSDIDQYFSAANLSPPNITDISVDGTQNSKGQPQSDADPEVTLDIQIAAAAYAFATGQAATIRVYWSQDVTAAIRSATSDGCDVCSISWGADEAVWGAAAGAALEQAAADATAAGMIVFAASGDNDSSDGGPAPANVDLPSSAPHVVGCGGTKKTQIEETVWNDDPGETDGEGTGGGFSTLFTPMPLWQAGAPHGPGRMVPDVAANADPNTGHEIILRGAQEVVGGTSTVAPLYAGLFAAFGEKLGFITPILYLNPTCFNDITNGDNGAFRAMVGPDPCTGLGSPMAIRLAGLFADPAATLARQLAEANAKITQLEAVIESLRAKDYGDQLTGLVRQPRIITAGEAPPPVTCSGYVSARATTRSRSAIKAIILGYAAPGRDPASISDAVLLVGSGGLLSSGPVGAAIWALAQSCMTDRTLSSDGLVLGCDIITQGTTVGRFVDYIQCCYVMLESPSEDPRNA